jgi:hypothetical protein
MPRQRDELPMDFPINYFPPGHAWRRAAIGPGHATGIEKQNATASFIARDVRVGVQENIDTVGRMIRCNVLQSKFQAASLQIEDQRPLKIAVAISAHNDHARPNRSQLVKDGFCAYVAKMPDFIRIPGHFLHILWQTIVRIGHNENPQHRCRFLLHFFQRKFGCAAEKNKAVTLMKA